MKDIELFPISSPIVVLIGPTAIGKTSLSIELAKRYNFEIVSVDSMQVYRFMNIGTAKITREEMQGIPHHLIDVVNPDEHFDAGMYANLAIDVIQDIASRNKNVLLTGGTGLYLRAALSGLSQQLPHFPEIRKALEVELKSSNNKVMHDKLLSYDRISALRIHKNDTFRVIRALEILQGTGKTWSRHIQEHESRASRRFSNIRQIGLTCERKVLYERINQRSIEMINNGLEEEVQGLLERGYSQNLKAMQGIGYKHMLKLLAGEWTHGDMIENLKKDTRRYAKRQYTWFNKEKDINWYHTKDHNKAVRDVEHFLHDLS